MQNIKVNLKERSYDIVIGKNIIFKLPQLVNKLKLGNAAAIITNSFIKNKLGKTLGKELKRVSIDYKFFQVLNSEKAKSSKELIALIEQIAKYGQEKKIFLIAFGGGVVGDLTGFCASIYKRGVPYIQIPTTLLAQVDSAIGGKTAIDLGFAKNLVGSFYQPRLVLSDIEFLKTLPAEQIKAGLSEVVKYAIIKDVKLFDSLEKKYNQLVRFNPRLLEYFISSSSKIKAKIVSFDERETRGERIILNFGHTIGHAIEAAYGYKYNHGQAIALGMIYEARLSYLLGICSKTTKDRIEKLIEYCKITPKIQKLNVEKVIFSQKFDKKFTGKVNKFILPKEIGKVEIVSDIPQDLIRKILTQKV